MHDDTPSNTNNEALVEAIGRVSTPDESFDTIRMFRPKRPRVIICDDSCIEEAF